MTRTVIWALPSELEAADADLVEAFDASVGMGEASAEGHLACRLGCTHCCIGPFEITALDAARLVRGVAGLVRRDPETASAVVRRASRQWETMAAVFPGDAAAGILAEDEAARDAFFGRFSETPCPALDPLSGACLVYEWRPLSCRSYGLPVRHGSQVLDPCPLNFTGASPDAVATSTVEPDPDDREGRLLARAGEAGVRGDTTVCAAIASLAANPGDGDGQG